MRTLPHKSAELSRLSLLNGCGLCLEGTELIISRVTRVNLSNQTWWAHINYNRAMYNDFYKWTIGNYVVFLDKTTSTFLSFSAQLVRLCAYEDSIIHCQKWFTSLYFSLCEKKNKTGKTNQYGFCTISYLPPFSYELEGKKMRNYRRV